MPEYSLKFPVSTPGAQDLTALGRAVSDIQGRVKLSANEFSIFQKELTGAVAKGGQLSGALKQLTNDFSNSTPALRQFAATLREQVGTSLDAIPAKAGRATASITTLESALGRIGGRIGGQLGVGGAGGFVGSQFAGVLGFGLAGGAAFAGIGLITAFIERQTKEAQQIQQLAQRLQVSTQSAISLSRAADFSGGSVGSIESAAEKISSALESPTRAGLKSIQTLQQLGIAFTESSGKARESGQVLEDVFRKLSKISDAAERARVAQELFGKSSDKILPIVDAYKQSADYAGRFGDELEQKVAKRTDDIARRTNELKSTWQQIYDIVTTFNGPEREGRQGNPTYRGIPLPVDARPRNSDGTLYNGPTSESRSTHEAQLQRLHANARALAGSLGAQTPEDLAATASDARIAFTEARSRAQLAVKGGTVDDATLRLFRTDLSTKRAAYEKAEAAVKALRAGPSEDNAVQAFIDKTSDAGDAGILGQINSIFRESSGLIRSKGLTGARRSDVQNAALVGARNLLAEGDDKVGEDRGKFALNVSDYAAKRENANIEEELLKPLERYSKEVLKNFEQMVKASDEIKRINIGVQGSIGTSRLRAGGRLAQIGIQDPARAAFAYGSESAANQSEFSTEYKLAREITNERERQKEIIRITGEFAKKSVQEQLDLVIKIAEVEQHKKEAFGASFSSLVLSAQNGGANGVKGFLRGQGEQLEGTVLSNFAQSYIYPQIRSLIPHANDPKSFAGKIFAGTGFGAQDPVTQNTNATDLNTKATLALWSAMTGNPIPSIPSSSGGGFSIPGIGTFGSDTNGITGSGGIGSVLKLFGGRSGGGVVGTPGDTGGYSPVGGTGGSTASSPASLLSNLSGKNGLAAQIGAGASIASAGFAAFKGIKDISKGGARGIVGGIGEIAGAAATLDPEPISKAILGAVALTSGVISSILGDPRQNRINAINKKLFTSQYLAPDAINIQTGTNGGFSDFDQFGNFRSSNLSPYPVVSNSYLDVPRRTVVPGHTISPFGGFANQTGAAVSNTPPVTVQVIAMDSKSFIDHSDDIAHAVNHALLSNFHPLRRTLREG